MSTEWQDQAKCRTGTHPPEMWHTEGSRQVIAYAKNICKLCPVIDACLEFALTTERNSMEHRHGVWGGLSPRERHELARQEKDGDAA